MKLKTGRLRKSAINLKCTDNEIEYLKLKSQERCTTVSAYIRELVFPVHLKAAIIHVKNRMGVQ